MINNHLVIDGHSHIGDEVFVPRGEVTLTDYLNFAKRLGVDIGLIMPSASPTTSFLDRDSPNKKVFSWNFNDGTFTHYSDIRDKDNLVNPYSELNETYFKTIQESEDDSVKVFFVPMINPLYDTRDYLEGLIEKIDPIAVKMHCNALGMVPEEIPAFMLKLFSEKNIPVIVHTDYDRGGFSQNPGMLYLRQNNTASRWGRVFNEHGVKGILNHGGLLEKEGIDLVNASENLRLGIGPELYLCQDPERLYVPEVTGNPYKFLEFLRDHVDIGKLIFDVDFDYNRENQKSELDYDCINRVISVFGNSSRKVLLDNSLNMYPRLRDN